MKHIVIVGGSFAGVSTAHRILKQSAKTATGPFKITLVSRDSHFYWNIAAPRALLPEQIPDGKLFFPIAPGFDHYPAGKFEFVLGSATGLDVEAKQLEVDDCRRKTKLDYDFLILGTGSNTKGDTPFKSLGSTESTEAALHEFQARVGNAKSIVVVGAGPTGVEVAGELGFQYGKSKQIILISNGPTVLEGRPASVSETAVKQLKALSVELKLNTKVNSPVQLPDGRHELTLSSRDKLVVDMYIPTFGVQPNTSYVPSKFLDTNGFIEVNGYLGIEGAEGVFAIGDVSNAEPPQFWFVEKQSTHLAKNMVRVLRGKDPLPYKVEGLGMIGIQIGKKTGTGHIGNLKMPSFIITMLRKSLFIEDLPRTVHGASRWRN